MSELTKSWLTAELLRVKSGYADWAVDHKTIWPQWSWERLGALAMTSSPKGSVKRSLPTLMELTDERLKGAGDRGWGGALCHTRRCRRHVAGLWRGLAPHPHAAVA